MQEAARPVTTGTRMVAATRGWLLPYLLILVVSVVELLAGDLVVGGFLVLAPLLASRLSSRRSQVIAVGLVTLVAAVALGLYASNLTGSQLTIRLVLIVLATLFALVNWGAAQREQSALERAADTIRMAGSLAAGLEPEQAYDLLARSARTLFAANVAAVYRRQGDQMVTVGQARDPEVPAMPLRLPRASYPAAFMTVTRPASVRSSTEPEAPMLEARGLSSLLWLPLLDRAGEQLGTIVLAWKRDPKLSAQALEASESFAGLGARAISGSERVRAQTEVLEQIQALLLSTPPAWVSGFQVGVRYQSASGLAQIGGDFYDVVELDERGLAFILADARGKGLEASSLAALLKGAFRSLAGEGAGPARILNRLDRLVAREGGDEDFVTALAGRLHPDGRILLASAGHPAPLGAGPRLVQVALALVGLGAEAEGGGHLDQAGAGAQGGRVAGRGEQDAAVGVDPAGQGGHEVLVAAFAGHQPVEPVEDAGRAGPLAGQAAEGALEQGGQRARLQPLAAGVGQDERQAALVQLDHVVEVAADLSKAAGRLVPDPDLEPGHPVRRGGQQQGLDLLKDLGLGPHPLGPGDGPGTEAGEALGGLQRLGRQLGVALPGEHDGAELLAGPVEQRQPEQAAEAAGLQHRRLRLGRGAHTDPPGHGHEGGREAGPRQPQRHRRDLGVAGLADGHHLVALAAVDGGHVGRVQRPGRAGQQVVGLLRLQPGGQRPGHPDGVGGSLQGRLLALGGAPVDQGEQRGQGDQEQADEQLAADQLAGPHAQGAGHHQGDQADADDLAAAARHPAGQQRGQDQEAAHDHPAGQQLDQGHEGDHQVREQPAAGRRDHPGAGRDRPGRLLQLRSSRLACPTGA